MEKYLSLLRRGGAAQAAVIDPKTIVTAPWVAFKCQYGCPHYGKNLCCPPHAPAWRETQAMIDCFDTAILFCCPAMEAVMNYAGGWPEDLDSVLLEIFLREDYREILPVSQRVEITFRLGGEGDPPFQYLGCSRTWME